MAVRLCNEKYYASQPFAISIRASFMSTARHGSSMVQQLLLSHTHMASDAGPGIHSGITQQWCVPTELLIRLLTSAAALPVAA